MTIFLWTNKPIVHKSMSIYSLAAMFKIMTYCDTLYTVPNVLCTINKSN